MYYVAFLFLIIASLPGLTNEYGIIPAGTTSDVRVSELVQPVQAIPNESSYVYKNATNKRDSSFVIGKCDSQKTKRRSFWLQSGVEKKELDNQWKIDTMNSTIQHNKNITEEVVGYYNNDPKFPHIIKTTNETHGPTEATRSLIDADRQKWEYNKTTLGNGFNSALGAVTSGISLLKLIP